ncbi:N-acetylglucosamine-6-phosphate deacetylase [Gloeocapsopsis dulcis]|uniref:N-acetylglucosamine-6-phosphate deacetylase n=1 Tax=Gloeocapsopsis dulcis AAB1 = 1H9 TaxID=1433147 RepID=A0A6N8FU28_9CHRO|nr:N-acetylglucosamine-6-phosphate deacetylase [Gloeocapsopsis dulcis]MUL36092.1 N-acetylglucosamine-6-phosphate deacetylase [Gloeocapsopsis dulcis AAB1 = 1H9]WNN91438.1 N-acetylglucosamine-6-phosphate deacetylase [Gloeocapsopsis dulcis]
MTESIAPIANLNIINARLPGYLDLQQICIAQDRITQILPMSEGKPARGLDVAGDWISLGGVDLQINGALGLAFPEIEARDFPKLEAICKFLWQQGVDGFLPTLVTTSIENFQRSLAVIAEFMQSQTQPQQAKVLGVHLEGPFLNYQKRGAHPAEYLLPLTIEQVQRVIGDYASIVKVITLAPELDATGEAIAYLRSLGITISLSHSQATADEAQRAFERGATMVTHAFNAMPGLHHREPGLLGAAIVHPGVWCGLIADGQHVCPIMLKILLQASGYEQKIFLVSDALAPLGLPDGAYPWDTRQITVNRGTAKLADGTLAGTTLPLLVGVQNLVDWGVCDAGSAIALATTAPRKAIHLPEFIGNPATQLLRWNWNETIKELTWCRLESVLVASD